MSFKINNNVNFVDGSGNVKNLATEMDKIGAGGSTVIDSATNGNILVNGSEVQVYDDTTVKNSVGTLANLTTATKSDLVSAVNEVKQGFSNLEVRTTDPVSPSVGQMWLRSDL